MRHDIITPLCSVSWNLVSSCILLSVWLLVVVGVDKRGAGDARGWHVGRRSTTSSPWQRRRWRSSSVCWRRHQQSARRTAPLRVSDWSRPRPAGPITDHVTSRHIRRSPRKHATRASVSKTRVYDNADYCSVIHVLGYVSCDVIFLVAVRAWISMHMLLWWYYSPVSPTPSPIGYWSDYCVFRLAWAFSSVSMATCTVPIYRHFRYNTLRSV